jgi:hypothetical protein
MVLNNGWGSFLLDLIWISSCSHTNFGKTITLLWHHGWKPIVPVSAHLFLSLIWLCSVPLVYVLKPPLPVTYVTCSSDHLSFFFLLNPENNSIFYWDSVFFLLWLLEMFWFPDLATTLLWNDWLWKYHPFKGSTIFPIRGWTFFWTLVDTKIGLVNSRSLHILALGFLFVWYPQWRPMSAVSNPTHLLCVFSCNMRKSSLACLSCHLLLNLNSVFCVNNCSNESTYNLSRIDTFRLITSQRI